MAEMRSRDTPEQAEARRAATASSTAAARDRETVEARNQRLAANAERMRASRRDEALTDDYFLEQTRQ
eukprot:scaffold453937_cov34-Prasinocladus_malaysianus.AAC.1